MKPSATIESTFVVERDIHVVCRVLGLFAARSIEAIDISYAPAATDRMLLRVCVESNAADLDALRILKAAASRIVGVIES